MTAAVRTGFGNLEFWNQSNAVSPHASRISKSLGQATVHGRAHAADWRTFTCALIEQLAADHSSPNWDGYGARPISIEAKQYAQAAQQMGVAKWEYYEDSPEKLLKVNRREKSSDGA